jgi:hypothetical protein
MFCNYFQNHRCDDVNVGKVVTLNYILLPINLKSMSQKRNVWKLNGTNSMFYRNLEITTGKLRDGNLEPKNMFPFTVNLKTISQKHTL